MIGTVRSARDRVGHRSRGVPTLGRGCRKVGTASGDCALGRRSYSGRTFLRLYMDNFRSLSNFDITLPRLGFLMGANASGKSSVFDVVYKLRRAAVRVPVAALTTRRAAGRSSDTARA